MTYCTDTDLLHWEPNLFNDYAIASQKLLGGTGDLAGTSFTIDSGSLNDAHVQQGQVIVLTGGTTGTYPIVSVDSDTELTISVLYDALFPLSGSPDPSPVGTAADLTFTICTFSPQAKVVSEELLRAAGLAAADADQILNPTDLRRACAAGALAMIFRALAVGEDRIELTDKAGQYERLYQRASRSIVLELDFDEDGEIDERRALYVVELQRL